VRAGRSGGVVVYVINVNDRKDSKIESYPYKGRPLEVKDVWIR